MKPLLVSAVRTPKIYWYQTDDRIVLRIMLIGVTKYFVSVDLDHIRFSAIHDNNNYYFCLYFFGAVIPEKTINQNFEREIKIQIPKALKFWRWLKLEYQYKNPQIISDPDKFDEVTWVVRTVYQPPWKDFEKYKRENNITSLLPADISSSEDESDDDRYCLLSD